MLTNEQKLKLVELTMAGNPEKVYAYAYEIFSKEEKERAIKDPIALSLDEQHMVKNGHKTDAVINYKRRTSSSLLYSKCVIDQYEQTLNVAAIMLPEITK